MKSKILLILGILLCTIWSFNNYNVLEKDNTPFVFDIYDLYSMSTTFYGYLVTFQINDFFHYYNNWENDYPPLLIFQAIPFYLMMGVSEDTAAFSNTIHIFILVFSVYFLGKKIHSSQLGIFSVILVSINPWVHSISRIYLTEFAILSIMSLTIVLFLYSENFTNRLFTLLFGVSFGLGMLTKFSFLLYFLPVIFILMAVNLKSILENVKSITYAIIPFFVLVMTWYPLQIMILFQLVRHNAVFFDKVVMHGPTLSEKLLGAVMNYYRLIEFDIIFFSILIGLILIALFSRKKMYWVFLISFIISFGSLLFFLPTIRFFLPLCLHMSIMAAYGLIAIKPLLKKKHIYFAFAILLLAFLVINRQPYERKTIDAVFSSGLYSPLTFNLDNSIFLKLKDDTNVKNVYILTSSPTLSIIERKLSEVKDVDSIFCLFNSEFDTADSEYCIEQTGKISECNYDAVIVSSPNLTKQRNRYLSAYPLQKSIFDNALHSWEKCRGNFYPDYTYYEGTEDIEISLWKRKLNEPNFS